MGEKHSHFIAATCISTCTCLIAQLVNNWMKIIGFLTFVLVQYQRAEPLIAMVDDS